MTLGFRRAAVLGFALAWLGAGHEAAARRQETSEKPRLEWSIFHPVSPDPEVMRRYLALADEFAIDGFEVSAHCYGVRSGMEGVLLYEDYPTAARLRNRDAVLEERRRLNEVVALARAARKRILFWHREAVLPEGILKDLPGILDGDGEIDFLGDAYWELLRYKVRKFLEAVPGIDGLVLTLTEAEYAVVNRSETERAHPRDIAARMIRTFERELSARGKTFVFRTFGSIERDYEILTGAAELALRDGAFEVETKVVPFDWSLVLPPNPYLRKAPGATLAGEFDLLGEFYGLGEIPCLVPELIVEQVRYARRQGCDRLVGRVDRDGRTFLDSVNRMNVFAFSRAATDPGVTAETLWKEWAAREWGEAASDLLPAMKSSREMILKAHYIDGHMFSQVPVPRWDYLMLGGIGAVFAPGLRLDAARDLWSIRSEQTSPPRARILEEKREAIALADRGFEVAMRVQGRIPERARGPILQAWRKARWTTRMQAETATVVAAYLTDLESGLEEPRMLAAALRHSLGVAAQAVEECPAGLVAEMADALKTNAAHFPAHFAAEAAARKDWAAHDRLVDFVVCGGWADEGRVRRYMHSSGVLLLDGRPARRVANKVFPNGFLEYSLRVPKRAPSRLLIRVAREGGPVRVRAGDVTGVLSPSPGKGFEWLFLDLPPSEGGDVRVRLEKEGRSLPIVGAVGVQERDP